MFEEPLSVDIDAKVKIDSLKVNIILFNTLYCLVKSEINAYITTFVLGYFHSFC